MGERNLSNLSYDDFGRLRFLDFFPVSPLYGDDDIGGTLTVVGYACTAGYGFTNFARSEGTTQTIAINLDFSQDCPEQAGNALLATLGLNLRCGMLVSEIIRQIGSPKEDQKNPEGFRFCSFSIGSQWGYRVDCAFDLQGKLYKVGIARKDLVVSDEQGF